MARTKQTSRTAHRSTGGKAQRPQLATKAARTHYPITVSFNPKTKTGRSNIRARQQAERKQDAEWARGERPDVWSDVEDDDVKEAAGPLDPNMWYITAIRFGPDNCVRSGHHLAPILHPYWVVWRKGASETTEEKCHTLADIKTCFPGRQAREDLKRFVTKAREKWEACDDSRVKIDGSHKRPIATVAVAAAPVAGPVAAWPIKPYYQEEGRLCAFNALRNLGFDLPASRELDGLQALVDYLSTAGIAKFLKVTEPARDGLFLYHVEGHCFSRVDHLFLDTDPAHPAPVRSMEELGFSGFDTCYVVKRIKKRKR